uniref:Lipoprotein n=1 Tax=Mycolicibacterium gilvum (strain PYR-GCK) TaxID=350054 RepID=A4T6J7_MYCGI|nr:hypothetical protein Mflv_1976 [Mycolicibacterium gilvum PYR-GCK]
MRRWFVAVALVLFGAFATGCEGVLPDNFALPSQFAGGEPRTLDAATAAAQEFVDRRAAGDYAGVWLMYSRQVRDRISQSDYAKLSQTCGSSLEKVPVTATGVRLDGETRALVRVKPMGFSVQLPVVYENGEWFMAPSDDFAADLGKPVDQIIAERRADGRCGDEDLSARLAPPSTSMMPPPPPAEPIPSTGESPSGQCSVDVPGCEGYDECHPVVTGKRDCFPEDESCSKPGNNFPWCRPLASGDQGTPVVLDCSGQPQVKPERIVLTCADNTIAISKIAWVSWSPDGGATGRGTEFRVECVPNCAQGTAHYSPVTITLTGVAPPDFRYTSATIIDEETGTAESWPMR